MGFEVCVMSLYTTTYTNSKYIYIYSYIQMPSLCGKIGRGGGLVDGGWRLASKNTTRKSAKTNRCWQVYKMHESKINISTSSRGRKESKRDIHSVWEREGERKIDKHFRKEVGVERGAMERNRPSSSTAQPEFVLPLSKCVWWCVNWCILCKFILYAYNNDGARATRRPGLMSIIYKRRDLNRPMASLAQCFLGSVCVCVCVCVSEGKFLWVFVCKF